VVGSAQRGPIVAVVRGLVADAEARLVVGLEVLHAGEANRSRHGSLSYIAGEECYGKEGESARRSASHLEGPARDGRLAVGHRDRAREGGAVLLRRRTRPPTHARATPRHASSPEAAGVEEEELRWCGWAEGNKNKQAARTAGRRWNLRWSFAVPPDARDDGRETGVLRFAVTPLL
jgi:hypothetical protein